jgi:hypothetical protein
MAKKPGWHLLELEVKKILKNAWWEVLSQEPYLDPIEWKARHIDILAIRKRVIGNNSGSPFWLKRDVTIEMRLFIECKFIPDSNVPAVLYYENKKKESMEKAFKWIQLYSRIYKEYVARDLITENDYSKSNIVIVQCSDNNEDWYWLKAIQQSCHWILSQSHTSRADYSIDYPVVIWDASEKIKIADSDDYKTESDYTLWLLYEYKYTNPRNKQNEIFFVDMLTLGSLHYFIFAKTLEFDKAVEVIRKIETEKQWHTDSYGNNDNSSSIY